MSEAVPGEKVLSAPQVDVVGSELGHGRRGERGERYAAWREVLSKVPSNVQRNGARSTRFHQRMKPWTPFSRGSAGSKQPWRSTRRCRIEKHCSIWLTHEACTGV